MLVKQNIWRKDKIEDFFLERFTSKDSKIFRVIPLIVLWGIWLARNSILLEDKFIPPF